MALERLQRGAPIFLHFRLYLDPSGDALLKLSLNDALLWGEDKS